MIRVNGEGWDICLVPPNHPSLRTPEGTQALGCCDDIVKTIFISNALPLYHMRKVLCHELAHAAMYSYDVPISDPAEEMFAELVATFGDEIISLTNMVSKKIKGY